MIINSLQKNIRLLRPGKAARGKILAVILMITLSLSLLPLLSFPASADDIPAGNAENGYVTDLNLYIHASTTATIPGFVFDPQTTDYDICLADTNGGFKLEFQTLTPLPPNLYHRLLCDGSATGGISGEKLITADTTTLSTMAVAIGNKFPIGETHTLTLEVGQKYDGVYVNSDVYNFNITRKPGLKSGFKVTDSASKSLTLAPAFSANTSHYNYSYSTVTTDGTIKLTAAGNSAAVKFFLGDDQLASFPSGYEITLADHTAADSDIAVIPFALVYDEADKLPSRSDYTLYVSKTDYTPKITSQPQAVTCDKDESPTLSIAAQPPAEGTQSYQWRYHQGARTVEIAGATGAAFSPPTDYAGDYVYDCVVSNTTVDGVIFQTVSAPAAVHVNLTYVSPPYIVVQPGSGNYKTEYMPYEAFNPLAVGCGSFDGKTDKSKPPYDIDINVIWYYNTVNSVDGAVEIGPSITNTTYEGNATTLILDGKSYPYKLYLGKVNTGYGPGRHYVFCVVTATAVANPELSATVTSDILELTYTDYTDGVNFDGDGSPENPFQLKTYSDLVSLRELVNDAGYTFAGITFALTNDIELQAGWEPIGWTVDPDKLLVPTNAFHGTLDGRGHTLTVAYEGLPLFNYVSDAVVKNLNIYGEKIAGNGLVEKRWVDYGSDYDYDTGTPDMITLDNVRLKSGSSTLRSGLLEGSGSGGNTIYITNCVVEEGVVIGYDKNQSGIGSFVGPGLNGSIDNSVSYATVYGVNVVGGLAGEKGQSMGLCVIRNSAFLGRIEASGSVVGGIIGRGYVSDSAPNSPPASILNCYVAADIIAQGTIGGIFGSEGGIKTAVNHSDIIDNHFYGTITSESERVGGIIGFYRSKNELQTVDNNYFHVIGNDEIKGIGEIETLKHDGFDADAACAAKTAEEFADGTVLALLNSGAYGNWTQGDKYPVLLEGAVLTRLEVSGDYKNEYLLGEELDLTGIEYTGVWSNGAKLTVDPAEVTTTGYDKNTRGLQTLTLTYGPVSAQIPVTVLLPEGVIEVSFALLGDTPHDGASAQHSLATGGLETWIAARNYTVSNNATVLDVLEAALSAEGIAWEVPGGNYITEITRNGVTIGQFTNGLRSGWMYTLNGVHSLLGVAEQFLADGDAIIVHYTDDMTLEDAFAPPLLKDLTLAAPGLAGFSFAADVLAYPAVSVPAGTEAVTLTAAVREGLTLKVNGAAVQPGEPVQIALDATEPTAVKLTVENSINESSIYTITITPAEAGTVVADAEIIRTDSGAAAAVTVDTDSLQAAVTKALETGAATGVTAVEIQVAIPGDDNADEVAALYVALPAAAADILSGRDGDGVDNVRIMSALGEISLAKETLAAAAETAAREGDGDLNFTFGRTAASATDGLQMPAGTETETEIEIGDVFEVELYYVGNDAAPVQITNEFGGRALTISLPYELPSGINPAWVAAWHVSAGSATKIPGAYYDANRQLVTFNIEHLSYFAVGYEQPPAETPVDPDPPVNPDPPVDPDPPFIPDPPVNPPRRPAANGGSGKTILSEPGSNLPAGDAPVTVS
ncbi:MAG: bacterial Ig-like domain-containing protein, partial [Gracilibacteraceae bacterium]|nr:bacterial Ig-like domain-containing protein [Gracilibacteraceae bacterium]